MTISYDEFEKVDFRSGTIVKVESFARAKKPAYKVWVDFGSEIGMLQTSAQIIVHYTPESLDIYEFENIFALYMNKSSRRGK